MICYIWNPHSNPTGQNHSKPISTFCTGHSGTHTITFPTETPHRQHHHQFIICLGTSIPTHEVLCLSIQRPKLMQRTGKDRDQLYHKKNINNVFVRGIAITSVHAKNKFQKVRDLLRPIHLKISARGKNVGNIDR